MYIAYRYVDEVKNQYRLTSLKTTIYNAYLVNVGEKCIYLNIFI